MGEELIGKVAHFYGKISVAVVELSGSLKVGEKIKFKRGEEEFEQTVDSMQVEHQNIQEAKAGQAVGLKTVQPTHEGAEVYRLTE